MKTGSFVLITFIIAFFVSLSLQAQTGAAKGKGRLRGTIVDELGKPVEGATVRFASTRLQTSFELTTNEKGEWVVAGIATENWDIDFSKKGYATAQISYEIQSLGYNKPVNILLKRVPQASGTKASDESTDPSKTLIREGSALANQKDYAGAIAKYEEAIKVKPESYALYAEIGSLYSQIGQPDKALESYHKLLEKDSGDQVAISAASAIYFEKKDLAGAKKVLSGMDSSKITNAYTFLDLGDRFYNSGDTAEAIKYWEKAIESDPQQMVDAYVQLGTAYLSMKQNDRARAMFEKVLELDPDGDRGKKAQEMLDTIK